MLRPPEDAEPLVAGLRGLGAEVILCPTIRILAGSEPDRLAAVLAGLDRYDWLAFTSANTVRAADWKTALKTLEPHGGAMPSVDAKPTVDVRLRRPRLAAVGPRTAGALRAAGLDADLVATESSAAGLARALAKVEPLAGRRVLIPGSDRARTELPEALRQAGAVAETVEAYRTALADPRADVLLQLSRGVSLLAFTSPSTIRGFMDRVAPRAAAGLNGFTQSAVALCIGPTTASAARDAGFEVVVVVEPHTVEGMLKAAGRIGRQVKGA